MRREVRANVIFIVVLVLLIAPGFVFLMKKKLNGSTRPNYMPDPAPHQIAYIQPLPAPPVPRVEPKEVREWVSGLVETKLGAEPAAGRRTTSSPAIVSDRFVTEVAAKFMVLAGHNSRTRIALVRWDDSADLTKFPPAIEVRNNDFSDVPGDATFYPATIVTTERVEVPRNVRHALQDVGYVDPPTHVWWIVADHTNIITWLEKSLRLTTRDAKGKAVQELIEFMPTPSTAPATSKATP